MQVPRLLVNAKVYAEATGQNALALADAMQALGRNDVAFAPAQTELALLARRAASSGLSTLQFFAQHVDPLPAGTGTGFVTPAMVVAAGAHGTLLNHAEHKLERTVCAAAVQAAKGAGLCVVACADSLDEARWLATLHPHAIAIEPPALIGGNVSVTTADPAIVRDAVRVVREAASEIRVLCGAGVKSGLDVKTALALGAHGVLLASGVTKAAHPATVLADLVTGLPP